jgi:hypothetical protein
MKETMLDSNSLEKNLGGPTRFAAKDERSIQEQLDSLKETERKCVDDLKGKWEEKHSDQPFLDEMYLGFARCSPGKKKFNKDASWKVMKKFNHRYLGLKVEKMESQLLIKVSVDAVGMVLRREIKVPTLLNSWHVFFYF